MRTKVKDIRLMGLSTAPNDVECEDGNLAVAIGVVHEDGGVRMVDGSTGKVVLRDLDGYVMYRHKNDDYDHMIVRNVNRYQYYEYNGVEYVKGNSFAELDGIDVQTISAIGNTIVAYSKDTIYYYVYDGDGYRFLGNKLPEISLSFGLKRKFFDYNKFKSPLDDFVTIQSTIPEKEELTNAVLSIANVFEKKWANEEGVFTHKFFVRYAVRLYDGTTAMVSAPIMMTPSECENPVIFPFFVKPTSDLSSSSGEASLGGIGIGGKLFFDIASSLDEFDNWKDIVKSVDIFVSKPILPYDQSGTVEDWYGHVGYVDRSVYFDKKNRVFSESQSKSKTVSYKEDDLNGYVYISQLEAMKAEYGDIIYVPRKTSEIKYEANGNVEIDGLAIGKVNPNFLDFRSGLESVYFEAEREYKFYPLMLYILPKRDEESIKEEIENVSNYYLVKSYSIDDLKKRAGSIVDVKIAKGVLDSIESREMLSEDYQGHDNIIPKGLKEYNGRLSLYNVKSYPFVGFSAESMLQMTKTEDYDLTITHVEVFMKRNMKTCSVVKECDYRTNMSIPISYVYYPSPDAYKMKLYAKHRYGLPYTAEVLLKEHEMLNGAYYHNENGDDVWKLTIGADEKPSVTGQSVMRFPSQIYTTGAYNPFTFEAENVEQVGNGEVLAMIPAAQALSQGQFGEFPMYCFTTEGIWALSVNDTGGWQSKQPISRDVLLNERCVLQMDQSVIFATKRGLMCIAGSKVECISEVFDGRNDVFEQTYAEYVEKAMREYAGIGAGTGDGTSGKALGTEAAGRKPTFKEYISGEGVSMSYDYRHQRIVIGNDKYGYCYVFGMKDKLWTCVQMNIISAVNSYPEAMVNVRVGNDNVLMDMSEDGKASDIGMPENGFVLTRPLKMDTLDVKTVTSVEAIGTMKRTNVDLMLYASNDMNTWAVAATTKGNKLVNRLGTPYRYWRVGVVCKMEPGEELTTLRVAYETREELDVR